LLGFGGGEFGQLGNNTSDKKRDEYDFKDYASPKLVKELRDIM